jgi:hypothetical protein
VADWTTVATAAISAGAAVLGAGLGYLTARAQSKGELERLRYEHGERHLSHRQAIYHDYLDSIHRIIMALGGFENLTTEELQVWAREHEHRLTAVRLFGTQAASMAAGTLSKTVENAMREPEEYEAKHEALLQAAWKECIAAMRPDTAPNDD